ncbi:MAG: DNA recombination protein RmuC, partial [Oleibacter sp.]|nr:DNA recombination protein RmuC [Thalassolituus sp.]
MIDTLPDFSLLSNEMILLCTLVALASGLAAALLATLVTWLIRDRKTTQLRHELQQLSEQYQRLYDANEITALELRETKQKLGSQLETQQAKYQQQALEFVRVTERLSERNEQLAQQEQQHALQRQEFEHQRQEFEKRVDALRQNEQLLKSELATIKEARQQEQHSAADKLATLQDAREQLTKEFENISNKIFEQKTKQFSEQSQLGLTGLLTPFKEQLEGLKKKVEDVHMVDVRDRTTLKTQIDELHKLNQQMSNEAHALTTALRGEKKTQGNWGEMVLETV